MKKLRGLSAALTGAVMAFTLLGAVAPTASASETLNLQVPVYTHTSGPKVFKEAKAELRRTKKDLRNARKTAKADLGARWNWNPSIFWEQMRFRDSARKCVEAARAYRKTVKTDVLLAQENYVRATDFFGCPKIEDFTDAVQFDEARIESVQYWSGIELHENLPSGPGSVANTPAEVKVFLENYPDMPELAKSWLLRDVKDGYILQVRKSTHAEFFIMVNVLEDGSLSLSWSRGGRGNANPNMGTGGRFYPERDESSATQMLGLTLDHNRPVVNRHLADENDQVREYGLRMWWVTLPGETVWSIGFLA